MFKLLPSLISIENSSNNGVSGGEIGKYTKVARLPLEAGPLGENAFLISHFLRGVAQHRS